MNSLNPLRFTSHKKNWEKCLLFQSWNDCLLNWAKWQLFSLKIVLGCHLSEKWCRFVNLLSFASSYFFLSLRKIMWPNSQDFLLRTQNEALNCKHKIPKINERWGLLFCETLYRKRVGGLEAKFNAQILHGQRAALEASPKWLGLGSMCVWLGFMWTFLRKQNTSIPWHMVPGNLQTGTCLV